MAYASITHVQAHCPRRLFTATSLPNATQVGFFLDQVGGVLDGVLLSAGYQLPIPAGATSALKVLERANAIGAWYEVEQAADASNDVDRAGKAWDAELVQLDPKRKGPTIELGAPRDSAQAYARAKTMEEAGLTDGENVFFTRDMEF